MSTRNSRAVGVCAVAGACSLLLALLYSIGAHGIMTLNDFKSVEGDLKLGLASLPAQLGVDAHGAELQQREGPCGAEAALEVQRREGRMATKFGFEFGQRVHRAADGAGDAFGSQQDVAADLPPLPEQPIRILDDRGHLRTLEDIERDLIQHAIEVYAGHMSEIARRLGIGRSTLYRKVREQGLEGQLKEAG